MLIGCLHEDYEQQIQASSALPWLEKMRSCALKAFRLHGFPSTKDEEWKYTKLESLLKARFSRPTIDSHQEIARISNIPLKGQISIHNSTVLNCANLVNQLPPSVLLQPMSQAILQHSSLMAPYLGKLLHHENAFQALNMLSWDAGVFLYIPRNVCIKEPIVISHFQDKSDARVHIRHLIILEEGSEATIVEDYCGDANLSYFTNAITEIFVAENAKVSHYKIQQESKHAYHIGQVGIQQGASSVVESHCFNLGGKLGRSDTALYFKGEHATCLLNGIYITTADQNIENHTSIHHHVPNCQSKQDYKGILLGKSRAVFDGKIVVSIDAQKSHAQQKNKNLLLSSLAEVYTKPQLNIFADDVLCSHGATIGQLDEDMLFYLATRGLDRQEASAFLIQAFSAENLNYISHPLLASFLSALLIEQLVPSLVNVHP